MQVLQTVQMSIISGVLARLLVPRTPVLVRILQAIQVSPLSGVPTRFFVPWTSVLVQVLQAVQMPIGSGTGARRSMPRLSSFPHPSQFSQITSERRVAARREVSVGIEPLMVPEPPRLVISHVVPRSLDRARRRRLLPRAFSLAVPLDETRASLT